MPESRGPPLLSAEEGLALAAHARLEELVLGGKLLVRIR